MARRIAASWPSGAALGLAFTLGASDAVAQQYEGLDPSLVDDGAKMRVDEEVPDVVPERRGLPEIRVDSDSGAFARLYGHLNWGVLGFDDGRDTDTYAPIDNANSVSRLGLLAGGSVGDGWDIGFRFEAQYAPYSTFNVSVLDDDPDWNFDQSNIRWIDLSLRNDDYGTVSLGQGSMATDGISLIDFSLTNLVAYASVGDSAAGQYLRFDDPTIPIAQGPRIFQAYQGLSGPRRVRARYDTPTYMGFGASAAYGRWLLSTESDFRDEDLFDLSLTWGQEIGDFRAGAGAGYFWDQFDREVLSGSGALLHTPTGLNLTVAGGMVDTDRDTADYWYVKGGLRRRLFDMGESAFSVDWYSGTDFVQDGTESRSVGVAAVQFVEAANTELYLTWRLYDYDAPGPGFENAQAVFGGFRFRF